MKKIKNFTRLDLIFLIVAIFDVKYIYYSLLSGEANFRAMFFTRLGQSVMYWFSIIFALIVLVAALYAVFFKNLEDDE
ncbi:hypothetical protein AADZ91_14760 [Colwelliaceae bacterium 6441]